MKRIAHITDIHLEEEFSAEQKVDPKQHWTTVLDDVKKRGIKKIIFGGDIGSKAGHAWFFSSLENFVKDTGGSYSIVLGNHDKFSEVKETYKTNLSQSDSELYYTAEDETHKYIFLDTSASSISDEQLNRLAGEIKQEKEIIIFMHHPVLQTEFAVDKSYPLEGKEKIKKILLEHKNPVTIFCGHLHLDDVRSEENITQYVSISSVFQTEKNADEIVIDSEYFGYRIIEFGDEIKTEIITFKTEHV